MTIDPLDELFERLNAGDISAAERAFLAYEPYLRMAVRRRLSGPLRTKLDSRDIVQSVWADLLSRCRDAAWRFTDRSHFRAFLVKAARNRLIERHRQHRRAIERAVTRGDRAGGIARAPAAAQRDRAGNELWKRMLEELSPAHREILFLKREGLPCPRSRTGPECTRGASAASSMIWPGGWRCRAGRWARTAYLIRPEK